MKYIKQFLIILLISFIGEGLNYLIPAPIPASIYGMVILFVCLCTKIIKLDDVKDTGLFLIEIMPLMFIPAGVGLMKLGCAQVASYSCACYYRCVTRCGYGHQRQSKPKYYQR